MPIEIHRQTPSLCIRRAAFEAANLTRFAVDSALGLTSDEFRVENDLIVVGPLHGDLLTRLIPMLEDAGLEYFDDYFELSGNWPGWLTVFATRGRETGSV
jgi:hypothetical protein